MQRREDNPLAEHQEAAPIPEPPPLASPGTDEPAGVSPPEPEDKESLRLDLSSRATDVLGTASALVATTARRTQGMAQTLVERRSGPYHAVDPFLRRQLYNELHTYPRKRPRLTRFLWLLTGIVGGHRFYLGKVGTAVLMMLTGGGLLLWWIIDGFRLNTYVAAHNDEQARRESADEPPIGMDFVPKVPPDALAALPEWAEKRVGKRGGMRKALGFMADAFMVGICGVVLGEVAGSEGGYSILAVVITMILMINLAHVLMTWHHLPVLRNIIRWDLKLRLFYQFNEPGRAYTLLFRPIVGIFYAPFSAKARSEVTLYLQIAGIFSAVSVLLGLFFGNAPSLFAANGVENFIENWVKNNVLSFFIVFAFASPLGATLMKHTLLRRPNWVRWMLSGIACWAVYEGLIGT